MRWRTSSGLGPAGRTGSGTGAAGAGFGGGVAQPAISASDRAADTHAAHRALVTHRHPPSVPAAGM
ncbi:hypothetical protein [Microbulbifer pacificus]|uniref:hypothetical protein n=1 Tax=Microbulbifer pacificus TaxID=407164 RepID=UPI0018F8B480|nr:hypothetical protein [Microbulbifer pacificus]